jgi:hypothetical protein
MSEPQGLALAFLCGCSYNWLISRWARSRFGDGMTGIWVAIGVLMTLALSSMVRVSLPRLHFVWLGEPLILSNQQHAALYELKFFLATGIPMLVGSVWRYLTRPLS